MCVLYCFVPFGKTVLLYCYANKSLESLLVGALLRERHTHEELSYLYTHSVLNLNLHGVVYINKLKFIC